MNDLTPRTRIRWKRWLVISLGLTVVVVLAAASFLIWVGANMVPDEVGLQPIGTPAEVFEWTTGIRMPADARVIAYSDTHDNWLGDGDFYLEIEVDAATIDSLLATRPRSGPLGWQSGKDPNSVNCMTRPYAERGACLTDADGFPMDGRSITVDTVTRRVMVAVWDS